MNIYAVTYDNCTHYFQAPDYHAAIDCAADWYIGEFFDEADEKTRLSEREAFISEALEAVTVLGPLENARLLPIYQP